MTQKKRKISIKKVIGTIFGLTILFISGLIIVDSAQEWLRYNEQKQTLKSVQEELQALEAQKGVLEATRDKLSNSDYVQNFARGVHLMSKSEEQIFVLPRAED